MKSKIAIVLAIASLIMVLLSGCGQKDIGEAKAKEIGLAYINKVFDANETEATISRDTVECLPYQPGAVVTGDPTIGTRVVYHLRVAKVGSMLEYTALVNGSTGKPYYAWRSERDIVLSDEQKAEANALFAEEKNWGEKHDAAIEELKNASICWLQENLMADYPVILAAETGYCTMNPVTTTFTNSYGIVLQNGSVYQLLMQWPSMQVLSVTWGNEQ